MPKFRKKPVVIEAWEIQPIPIDDMPEWVRDAIMKGNIWWKRDRATGDAINLRTETLEGSVSAAFGDMLMKGVRGELYPCRADIFAEIYDAVEEPTVHVVGHQWFKNGDHPFDNSGRMVDQGIECCEGEIVRYFRHARIGGNTRCLLCSHEFDDHGWIDSTIARDRENGDSVCPGDYICIDKDGRYYVNSTILHRTVAK